MRFADLLLRRRRRVCGSTSTSTAMERCRRRQCSDDATPTTPRGPRSAPTARRAAHRAPPTLTRGADGPGSPSPDAVGVGGLRPARRDGTVPGSDGRRRPSSTPGTTWRPRRSVIDDAPDADHRHRRRRPRSSGSPRPAAARGSAALGGAARRRPDAQSHSADGGIDPRPGVLLAGDRYDVRLRPAAAGADGALLVYRPV